MKPVKKPMIKPEQKPMSASAGSPCPTVSLTVVSQAERDIYRVPSYGYIL